MSVLLSNSICTALFEAIAREDETAFRALFDHYKKQVYSIAFKWTKSDFAAEEITQDVFISIWVSRSKLPLVKDPQAYIYTAIYNKVSRYLKKETNKSRILEAYLSNKKDFSDETEETLRANETEKIIYSAVEQLPQHKKKIYKLSRLEGRTNQQIAETMQVSPHTIKSHLVNAVKSIRLYIKENSLLLAFLLLKLLS